MGLLANSNAIESGGYLLQRSLRFRSSASAYLNRTMGSPTDNTKWTLSAWVKRGVLGADQVLMAGFVDANNRGSIYIDSGDNLHVLRVVSGTAVNLRVTNAVFRDPSSWYHIVVIFDSNNATVANRIRLFVNNIEQTYSTSNDPGTGGGLYINRASTANYFGQYGGGASYFDGYLAEVNFIDGQALTPSSFGATDATTGVWQPAKYTGTYGTNGFYLPFSDNTSATTLAYDKSGNGNNWTPNNISTTAGATYDSMTDVPTLTSATAANFAVFNPLDKNSGATASNGNLNVAFTGAATGSIRATFGVSSGKWYWECVPTTVGNGAGIGVLGANANIDTWPGIVSGVLYISPGGSASKNVNGTESSYGASYTDNDVIGVALDCDGGTITFYKNNTSQGAISGIPSVCFPSFSDGSGVTAAAAYINFGQRPFSYTPPTGFKALNTFNLPDPTIKKPNQYMDATLWAGNGSTQTIANASGFAPDLVWYKGRGAAYNHRLFDTVRGATKDLQSNATDAEGTTSGLTAFTSTGFSLGSDPGGNNSGQNYVGWQWQAGKGSTSSNTSGSITSTVSVNATAGFSVATYTGNGSTGSSVGHGLGIAPAFVICKCKSNTGNWIAYHSSIGINGYVYVNQTVAAQSATPTWGISSSTVTFQQNYGDYNHNGYSYVMYSWAQIAGYSKFGSYTGNGSADGPFVYCGFRPKYVMVKASSRIEDWHVMDTSRSTYNQVSADLFPNTSGAEDTLYNQIDIVSNGFKLRSTNSGTNYNAATYIFMAFAENPFKNALAR